MKVCFLFIAQRHQILHGVSVAAELAAHAGFEVHVAAATEGHLAYLRGLLARLRAPANLILHRLWAPPLPWRGAIPRKTPLLLANAPFLGRFDVLVAPDRKSLALRAMGLRRQVFVHTDPGAGDGAAGYDPRLADFDLLLLAGEKQRRRLREQGLLREGGHAVVGYPKFDVVDAQPPPATPLFAEPRPVVLYNPHHRAELGSWDRCGRAVLEQFAACADYNLVFAPHVRLFDARRPGPASCGPGLRRPPEHPCGPGGRADVRHDLRQPRGRLSRGRQRPGL